MADPTKNIDFKENMELGNDDVLLGISVDSSGKPTKAGHFKYSVFKQWLTNSFSPYVTRAEEAVSVAKSKAEEASSSASSAKTYSANAKVSETNAKASETNAKSSETSASSSAESASASAALADTKASEAKNSATSASTSASSASSAKTGAESARDGAVTAKTAAENYASSASDSKDSASASATLATTKATEASTSAANAKASEANAKVSETKAKEYAESANMKNYAKKATTLAGYGITDAYTKTEADGKYQLLSKLLSVGFVLADGKADIQIGDEIAGHGGVIYADLAVAKMGLDMTWTVPSVTWNEYERDVHGVHLIKDNGNPRYLAMDYTDLGTANNYGTGSQTLTWGPNDQNWTDMIDGVGAFTESGAKYTPTAVTYNGIALEADWCPTIGRRNMWVPMCMMKGTDNSWIASDLANSNWGKSSSFWKAAWVKAGAIPYDYSRADRTKHPFYVPTKTEIQALNRAHWLRKVTSSFWSWYWSSTNYSDTQAWCAGFNWGNQYAVDKVLGYIGVRLVRTF